MKCESMVWLNQIFTNLQTPSCPLPGELTAESETFTQQLSFYNPTDENGCSCGCCCDCNTGFEFSDDLSFVIESTQVFVNNFALADPDAFPAANVTLNGLAVDELTVTGDRFTITADSLMPQLTNCICLEKNQSTKALLLIQGAGPWVAKLTIVIYGSVFGCGACKKFKLVMTTREGVSIDIPGTSTFAVSQLCLPCTKGGISPVIQFSFLAKASLLNPVITTDSGSGACNVILTGSLVTEPAASIQVTRETLFTIDATAMQQPCDDMAKCLQASGNCTCSADFPPIESPCCNDSCNTNEASASGFANGSAEKVCGCTCSCQDECSRDTTPKQICCQFNGYNGCNL